MDITVTIIITVNITTNTDRVTIATIITRIVTTIIIIIQQVTHLPETLTEEPLPTILPVFTILILREPEPLQGIREEETQVTEITETVLIQGPTAMPAIAATTAAEVIVPEGRIPEEETQVMEIMVTAAIQVTTAMPITMAMAPIVTITVIMVTTVTTIIRAVTPVSGLTVTAAKHLPVSTAGTEAAERAALTVTILAIQEQEASQAIPGTAMFHLQIRI